MVTQNAFIFAWDMYGIESIVPITQYEQDDAKNLIRLLKDESPVRSPLNNIMQRLVMRARVNGQRSYEIYSIDCDASLDEEFWKQQWNNHAQTTAELIRERGQKLYSDRASENTNIKIT